jgi:hypothetical protein
VEFVDEYFPFWTPDSLRKHLRSLVISKLLITKQPLKDKGNMTLFYRINYEQLNDTLSEYIPNPLENNPNPSENNPNPTGKNSKPSGQSSDSYKEAETSPETPAKKEREMGAAARIVTDLWKVELSNFVQESIDFAGIEDLELWTRLVNLNKASFDEVREKDNTYKQRLVRFVLKDYFDQVAAAPVKKSNGFKSKAQASQDELERARKQRKEKRGEQNAG